MTKGKANGHWVSEEEKRADYARRAAKRRQAMLERHGVDNPAKLESAKAKARATNLERYGVDNPRKAEPAKAKARETCLERYGVDSFSKTEAFREKVAATNIERYGVSNFMQSRAADEMKPLIVAEARRTQEKRYGTPHWSQSETARTWRKEHGAPAVSHPKASSAEEVAYAMLCDHFGAGDVECQHSDVRYPFACDFWIRSRDLWIELNGSWTHGRLPWMPEDPRCDTFERKLERGMASDRPDYKCRRQRSCQHSS